MRLQSRIMLRPSRSKKNLDRTVIISSHNQVIISSLTRSEAMFYQPDVDKAVCDADTGAWNTTNNTLHVESQQYWHHGLSPLLDIQMRRRQRSLQRRTPQSQDRCWDRSLLRLPHWKRSPGSPKGKNMSSKVELYHFRTWRNTKRSSSMILRAKKRLSRRDVHIETKERRTLKMMSPMK